jgi:hypothetical protein
MQMLLQQLLETVLVTDIFNRSFYPIHPCPRQEQSSREEHTAPRPYKPCSRNIRNKGRERGTQNIIFQNQREHKYTYSTRSYLGWNTFQSVPRTMGQILTCAIFLFVFLSSKFVSVRCVNNLHPSVSYTPYPILFTPYHSTHPARDESGVDNFRIRSDPNPNYADVEKSF